MLQELLKEIRDHVREQNESIQSKNSTIEVTSAYSHIISDKKLDKMLREFKSLSNVSTEIELAQHAVNEARDVLKKNAMNRIKSIVSSSMPAN